MNAAPIVVFMFLAYAAFGVLFALVFLFSGLRNADDKVEGAHPLFRLMILPGVIGLWPLVWWRYTHIRRQHSHPEEHGA
jgi:hypothetical protein